MSVMAPLVEVTLRGLLGRRRTLLLVLLAGLPVLIALLIRVSGGRPDADRVLDTLVVRTVMPLVALIVGTAAIGSEIEDGTAVYLMVKPIARWRIALAKGAGGGWADRRAGRPVGRADRVPARRSRRSDDGRRRVLGRLPGRRERLRRRVHDAQRVHVAGAPARPGLHADLGRRPRPGCWKGPSSCRSARRRSGSRRPSASTSRAIRWCRWSAFAVLAVVLVGGFLLASWKLARFEIRGGD